MQKTTKALTILFLIFVISIFYISLNRDTSYNTSSLINKELPEFEISFFNEKKFYKNNDLKKNNYTLIFSTMQVEYNKCVKRVRPYDQQ